MTDEGKLKALLGGWGVPYYDSGEDGAGDVQGRAVTVGGWGREDSPKVGGYGGFYTRFEFEADGSFRLMGAWE